jgi:hypothetical protein
MIKIEIFILPKVFLNNKLILNRLGKVYDIHVTFFDIMNKLKEIKYSENKEDSYLLFSYSLPDFYILTNSFFYEQNEYHVIVNALFTDGTHEVLYDNTKEPDFNTIINYIEKESKVESGDYDFNFSLVNSPDLLQNILNEVIINSYEVLTDHLLKDMIHTDKHAYIRDFYNLISKSILSTYKYIGEVYKIEFDDNSVFKPIGSNASGLHIIERFTTDEDFKRIKEILSHIKLKEEDSNAFNDIFIRDANIQNFKFFTRNGYMIFFTYSDNNLKIHIENIMTDTAVF